MNKRIKELAEQAGYPDHMTYGQDLVLERFAELIVAECAELANEETSLPYNSYSEKIRKHFGVGL